MVPQPIQHHEAALRSTVSITVPNPQFPGIHAPMIPAVRKQSPPKLTSHSLALLNAFKNRDQAAGEYGNSTDLPLRRYAQDVKQAPPQELPAELARPAAPPVDLLSLFKAKDSPLPASTFSVPSPQPPISEAHRSALLGLFKSPTTQNAVPLLPAATAFPISATPSAVELSAVEPHSNTAPIPALFNDVSSSDSAEGNKNIPKLNPEANLPFRAITILSRPQQPSSSMSSSRSPPKPEQNGKKHIGGQSHKEQSNRAQQGKMSHIDGNVKPSVEKPFQPQILKRPQQTSSKHFQPDNIVCREPAKHPLQAQSPSAIPVQASLQAPGLIPLQPSFDRRSSQTTDNKQALLSLFGKSSSPALPFSRTSTQSVDQPLASKSRVASLASGVDGVSSRGSQQAPMSPADKSFLLNYLDSVAKGAQQ
jgi:mRNA-decapping enzyme subunit 2